jgi:UMP-CMP kinase
MDENNHSNSASNPTAPSRKSADDVQAPSAVMTYPPLAYLLNAILTGLNYLRECPLLTARGALLAELVTVLRDSCAFFVGLASDVRVRGARYISPIDGVKQKDKMVKKPAATTGTGAGLQPGAGSEKNLNSLLLEDQPMDKLYATAIAQDLVPHVLICFESVFPTTSTTTSSTSTFDGKTANGSGKGGNSSSAKGKAVSLKVQQLTAAKDSLSGDCYAALADCWQLLRKAELLPDDRPVALPTTSFSLAAGRGSNKSSSQHSVTSQSSSALASIPVTLTSATATASAAASSKKEVVFVLGGPGSGKGTNCARIVDEFGYVHLSAGDLLRAERSSGSELAEMINTYIAEGKIVPAEVTVRLLRAAIEEATSSKFLVDGFPRDMDNLKCWEDTMSTVAEVQFLLFLDCPQEVMLERLLERGKTSGRNDDNEESIRKRFFTYEASTRPIIEHFRDLGKVRAVDSNRPLEEVYAEVQAHFQGV